MAESKKDPLKWTAQLSVADTQASTLQGDKILLPPSALEQLLSAATVVITGQDDDSYNNPWGSGGGPLRIIDRKQDLPHPLTFRLVNPSNGDIAYAGIRQFTADEGQIEISNFLRRALDIKDGTAEDKAKVTIHIEELPKGTYVKLRPLEAGYDADWKPLLERYMRTNFTTLTKGIILDVPSDDGKEYRFLVDELKPEGTEAICIVDTDLEVDIEALNEDQARETVKRKSEQGDSDGVIQFGQTVQGDVPDGGYVDYTLATWDRSKDISIELTSEGEVDLYLSPLSSRQRSRPRQEEHVIAAVEGSPRKIELRTTNIELENAEQLYITVHGYEAASYSLTVGILQSVKSTEISTITLVEDEVICKNCEQSIPQRTLFLHESFCYRNNTLCPKCHQIFPKESALWDAHWHCLHDTSNGNTITSYNKHMHMSHTPLSCPGCNQPFPSRLSLAQHRTTICPAKPILCQFCHLLVAQQSPEDPDFSSAEVLLSNLTPHEITDGSRTTECHLCTKFIRLRDMAIHMRHHDLARKTKPTPNICSNLNCGRTIPNTNTISASPSSPSSSPGELGLCPPCFTPLYASSYDPEQKALKRRIERRYLTQFLTGCSQDWCRNEYCKTAREYAGLQGLNSKDGLALVRPALLDLGKVDGEWQWEWRFCVDGEGVQKRRILGGMMVAVSLEEEEKEAGGYELGWWVKALEVCNDDVNKARSWLGDWGRRVNE